MRWLVMAMLVMPAAGQELDDNFEKMLTEVNRGRFDRALTNLFPVQGMLYQQLNGKYPKMDAGQQSRMGQMRDTTAVLSTIAILRANIESKKYEEAMVDAVLVGLGLTGLWMELPPYQKLNYAKQDLAEATPRERNPLLKRQGWAAYEAGEYALARETARELIQYSGRQDLPEAEAASLLHAGITIRGLAELGSGNVAAAEKSMIESMTAKGGGVARVASPNTILARLLLDQGRKASVDAYLKLLEESVSKDSSKAAEWRKALAEGKDVDLPRVPAVN